MTDTETTTKPKAAVSVRVLSDGSKEPRYVRGNGDKVFKAMAIIDPSKLPQVVKANKLGDKIKAPGDYPNFGRYVMTVSNVLRAFNKVHPLVIGKLTVPPADQPAPELDAAFEAAIEAAEDFATKVEQKRIDAANKKRAEKDKAKAKAKADKEKAAADKAKPKK
jgi:hypothetical protein